VQRRGAAAGGRLGAVLFTDIVGSTAIAAELGNRRWAELIGRHHQLVRRELRRFGGREHDTAGDGFFATLDRPVDAIRCAVAIAEAVRSLGIDVRAGVTFGELELESGKPSGLAVNTAARVMAVGGPGEVLVPASVRDIVSGSGITFREHGTHRLKGLEDEIRLFVVTAIDGEPVATPLVPEEAAARRAEIAPAPNRPGRWVALGAVILAIAAAAVVMLQGDETERPPRADAGSRTFLVELDPTDGTERQRIDIVRPSRSAQHPDTTRAMVAEEAAVWVVAPGFTGATLLHVDPEHGEVRDPILIAQPAITVSMVSAFDALWYLAPDRLVRVSASTDEQDMVRRVASTTDLGGADRRGVSLAADRDHLWIGQIDGRLMRVDPSGGVERRRVADAIDLIAANEDGVWVLNQFDGVVIRVDPATLGTVWEAQVVGTVSRLAVDENYLWLLDQSSGVLTRVSSSTGANPDPAPVGRGVTNLAVGLGAVWLSHEDGTISRVDRLTLDVTEFAQVEGGASAIAVDVGRDSIWVDVGPPVVNKA
jgi:class 3 adenylate cyclase/streptogramin lyase